MPAIRGVHSNSGAGRIRGAIRRAPCFYRTYAAHGWPVLLPCARLRLSSPPLNYPRLSACATSSFSSHLCMGALPHLLSDPSCAPMNITQQHCAPGTSDALISLPGLSIMHATHLLRARYAITHGPCNPIISSHPLEVGTYAPANTYVALCFARLAPGNLCSHLVSQAHTTDGTLRHQIDCSSDLVFL